MAETSLPISAASLAKLQEMAVWLNRPVCEILDRAIEAEYSTRFWDAVNSGYAAQRANPEEWAQVEAERNLWNSTLMDGLDRSEHWNDDGGAATTPRERAS